MAVTYEVCPLREENGGAGQGQPFPQLIKSRYSQSYDVTISDSADPTFDPADYGPFDVLSAPGIPEVNKTTYVDPRGNVYPYLVCRDKTAKRHQRRVDRWRVDTRWDTGTNDVTEIIATPPPVAYTDYNPKVEEGLGQFDFERWLDINGKKALLPSDNFFQVGFMERISTIERRVTQYEAPGFTYELIRSRKFSCNQNTYAGRPAYEWLIKDVVAIDAEVLLQSGLAPVSQVTYTLENRRVLNVPDKDGNLQNYGWEDIRPLIDTHYNAGGGEFQPFVQDPGLRTLKQGFVDGDGNRTLETTPRYDAWRMYPIIDFDGFLRA